MKRACLFCAAFILVAFFAFYKLSETPPTWLDEGVITQVARNIALGNGHDVQVAPHEYASGSFISTAYPVTIPVAISFKIFGFGILQARMVMALFILGLFIAIYFFVRRKIKNEALLFGIALLVATFAPIYGHGKNVLGEIPGMFYLFLGAWFLEKIFEGDRKQLNYILGGLFLGLSIVTKPIFILLAPAALVAVFIYRKQFFPSKKDMGIMVVLVCIPILVWLVIQFQGDTLHAIFTLYTNPNAAGNILATVQGNILRFFKEAQPMYTLILFLIWSITLACRIRTKKTVGPGEMMLWFFSALILLAFLRTAGFYRYFFEAELLSLVFVFPSLNQVFEQRHKKILITLCFALVILQGYQTIFNSWVATHAEGKRSVLLTNEMGKIDPETSVFFYQVPEAVNFLKPEHQNYYQFVRITDALAIGEKSLDVLKKKQVDLVVTSSDQLQNPLFIGYNSKEFFDRYVIFSK